jgi:hypothetical protein
MTINYVGMKKHLLHSIYVIVVLCIASCGKGPGLKEKPDNIISTPPPTELLQKIMDQFPENKNNKAKQAALFGNVQKRVILTKESEVFVRFISEGAGYENTFGYYTYDSAAKPSQASSLELHVLFPTVSDRILKQGDMLQVGTGTFPAGTVVGFFLIIRGWENLEVHYDRPTFYTDYQFNPSGMQQHILFKQKELGDLVLAFEDQTLTEVSDQDFNDILFTVTDNKENKEVTNFDMRKISQ